MNRIGKLASILSAHHVAFQVDSETGILEAWDVVIGPNHEDRSKWVDVTLYTVRDLYRWLGY